MTDSCASMAFSDFYLSLNSEPLFEALNIEILSGDIVCLMGPSGSGKSSILSAIIGELAPVFSTHGTITINGTANINTNINADINVDANVDTNHVSNRQPADLHRTANIGILYQDSRMFPHMNVTQNLQFALPAGLSKKTRQQKLDWALSMSQLSEQKSLYVNQLSGGQAARVCLMRTLLANPSILLLDEPFAKLDRPLKKSFRHWLYALLEQNKIPTLIVTHDPHDCEDYPTIQL